MPPQEAGALERRLVLVEREVDVRARRAGLPCRFQQQARHGLAQPVLRPRSRRGPVTGVNGMADSCFG